VRIVRIRHDGNVRYGLADESTVTLISDDVFAAWEPEDVVELSEAILLAPVIPTKIVCVGLNYHEHAEELGMEVPESPVIFLKPSTTINVPDGDVQVPEALDTVDYEAELAAVIGRRTHRIGPDEVSTHVLGYTCANDVTARPYQKADGQWTRAKCFDGFCPAGPWIETEVDPSDLLIESRLNGETCQRAHTSDMIFDIPRLVSFISHVMTLLPGDLVLTGTPPGVGPAAKGDVVDVEIEGIGTLTNRIV
jgi:2-keto-4-pentenoate hydratase/2-oxohepta-3-ene-1,7-dioic acid hydratase in catechol pathway